MTNNWQKARRQYLSFTLTLKLLLWVIITLQSFLILQSPSIASDITLTSGVPYDTYLPAMTMASNMYIDVGPGATRLRVSVTKGTGDLDLYLKYGNRLQGNTVGQFDADTDFISDGPTADEQIIITPASSPPLRQGRWYIGVLNLNGSTTHFTVTAIVDESESQHQQTGSSQGHEMGQANSRELSRELFRNVRHLEADMAASGHPSQQGDHAVSMGLGGQIQVVEAESVGTGGHTIRVNRPDSPLHGMEITVPEGSYPEETYFSVSYRPIESYSGDPNFQPVTPLITIANGGTYSDRVISVKIPVEIQDGFHYMAFYYDEDTGRLEGIPELDHDDHSLTIATRHFSNILINRMVWSIFLSDYPIESGFEVGKDNWQFSNDGTYLEPDGLCNGMTIAAMHYYREKRKGKEKRQPLFGLYNNGTPGFTRDDDQAIKLCSTIQNWGIDSPFLYWLDLHKKKNDTWTYFMFIHALLLTGRPQYVAIFADSDNMTKGSGHAMVVYKRHGSALYVADPNLPNDSDVKIEFQWSSSDNDTNSLGHFMPFVSSWNTGSQHTDFKEVNYVGYTALLDHRDVKDLWDELDKKSVPWNSYDATYLTEEYPSYRMVVVREDGTTEPLTSSYRTTAQTLTIKIITDNFTPRITSENGTCTADDTCQLPLNPGHNKIGIFIEAYVDSRLSPRKYWTWTDFKYYDIYLDEGEQENQEESVVTFQDHSGRWFISLTFPEGQGDGYLLIPENLLSDDVYAWGELIQVQLPEYHQDPDLWPKASVPVKLSLSGPEVRNWYLYPAGNSWDPASRNTTHYWKNETGAMELTGKRYYWLYIYPTSGPYVVEVIQLKGTANGQ